MTLEDELGGGSRDPDAPVGWVCLVCFAAASDVPAECARDRLPLAPLDDLRTRAALRVRLAERAAQREFVRLAVVLALGVTLALAAGAACDWLVAPTAAGELYVSRCAWLALLLALALGAVSLAIAPPLGRPPALPALLRQLRLDVTRNVRRSR